jgi:adenylate cyclase
VVEGTVAKAGSSVRINAQLVDARRDQHLWARQYDRELQDILQLQHDLASAIVQEVAGKLTPSEQSRFTANSREVNPEAYDAFLRGRPRVSGKPKAILSNPLIWIRVTPTVMPVWVNTMAS